MRTVTIHLLYSSPLRVVAPLPPPTTTTTRRGPTVQLRGLPYRATEREIADWLSEAADPVEVVINMGRWEKEEWEQGRDEFHTDYLDKLCTVYCTLPTRDGRPAGSADAVFETVGDACRVVSGSQLLCWCLVLEIMLVTCAPNHDDVLMILMRMTI